jgi:flagellum-specific ATP synthase
MVVAPSSLLPDSVDRLLAQPVEQRFGSVSEAQGLAVSIEGLERFARLGDRLQIESEAGPVEAEVIAIARDSLRCYGAAPLSGVKIGARACLSAASGARPSHAWIGKVMDAHGLCGGRALPPGVREMRLDNSAPVAARRKRMGARLDTGLAAFDALLPICRGQRLGIFAGPGVGKSMLLADLARGMSADVAVIALIGERGREVRAFVEDVLGPAGLRKAVVIATSSDQPALLKRRGAQLALATAEYFRDEGLQALLIFDSLTRFADAHREIALAAGEPPSLHAYPPSTFRAIAELVERAGPGETGCGDITAIFSVLVAGSDMNEPVADIVRGVLDGHVVLERAIAERGRFPAIDFRRSVSRSLPGAASEEENALIQEARANFGIYEDAEIIVRAGLYAAGSDPKIDRALKVWPALDRFLSEKSQGPATAFARLKEILAP